ncbi:glycosyltransferase family 31 protein [Cercospora zeae-maydis SCOH1-5]|uniref:N-acetylgalactosaminide beta-1,3-galactosyltransferase n=1 Tax=Cercospora zeae-maydis SCOH1-5 TaxID=717836 RepID=A0A6A6F987_9PEZI|nr:glycosyltransferase family 31 protein [Cercospora zeae-maydis SCOH1-5]
MIRIAVTPLGCWDLPIADDTLVIIKTGSTELDDRFAVQLSTTLRCIPQYIIFSDLEETYRGERIYDALESVSSNIRDNNRDFELYRRLQAGGRAVLKVSELSGAPEAFSNDGGHQENAGWKLDKWKFMPMVNRTFYEYPDMKWYVFIEADTFLLWTMLQQYLSRLDHTKAIYAGSPSFIGDELFAHGGSGFLMSQPALRSVATYYATHKHEVEQLTEEYWAGDCVLGIIARRSGVQFHNIWPHFQGDYPGLLPYARADGRPVMDDKLREWCYPTISYHHMSSDMIRDFWHFEQSWAESHNPTETLLNKDIFRDFVMPQMMAEKADWDNLSDAEEADASNLDECRVQCEAQPECKQFSFQNATGKCNTRVDPRLGKPSNGTMSQWLWPRIQHFEQDMASCGAEGWREPFVWPW